MANRNDPHPQVTAILNSEHVRKRISDAIEQLRPNLLCGDLHKLSHTYFETIPKDICEIIRNMSTRKREFNLQLFTPALQSYLSFLNNYVVDQGMHGNYKIDFDKLLDAHPEINGIRGQLNSNPDPYLSIKLVGSRFLELDIYDLYAGYGQYFARRPDRLLPSNRLLPKNKCGNHHMILPCGLVALIGQKFREDIMQIMIMDPEPSGDFVNYIKISLDIPNSGNDNRGDTRNYDRLQRYMLDDFGHFIDEDDLAATLSEQSNPVNWHIQTSGSVWRDPKWQNLSRNWKDIINWSEYSYRHSTFLI